VAAPAGGISGQIATEDQNAEPRESRTPPGNTNMGHCGGKPASQGKWGVYNHGNGIFFAGAFMFFDPMYFLFVAPAFLLGPWAQMRIQSSYAAAQRMPARLSGAAAARKMLDSAGLNGVEIEQTPGHLSDLSDDYDPRDKVLRLSGEVYESRSLAAVEIAAGLIPQDLQGSKGEKRGVRLPPKLVVWQSTCRAHSKELVS
jgi:hypothetical protein